MMRRLFHRSAASALLSLSILSAMTPARAAGEGIARIPARAGAPYSAATKVNGVLYLAGQLGTGPDGKLPESFEAQAKQSLENVKAILTGQGLTMDDVFKCTVMLTDMANFPALNTVYRSYFKPDMLPSRSTFAASGLASGALVEIECMARAG